MTVTAWSLLCGGVLTGKYNTRAPAGTARLSRDAISDRVLGVVRIVQEVARSPCCETGA